MARIPVNSCGHLDWPCCGCDDVVLTGEDAVEAMNEMNEMNEMEDFEPYDCDDDPFHGDDCAADADVLRGAGMGTDEDYGCFDGNGYYADGFYGDMGD